MNTDNHTRDEALRRMLVATVDSGPAPARPRWRLAVASIGAFALAGALTGGALASSADGRDGYEPFEITAPPILDDDVRVLGTPLVVTGDRSAAFDLGAAPDGANGVALGLYCLETGSFEVALDGRAEMGMTCTPDSGPGGGGGGGVVLFEADAPRELSVAVDSGTYAIWAAWVDQPADADPSAAQPAAFDDGVVTREEYVAGFERYVTCLADLGFEVYGGDTGSEIIGYALPGAAGQSGAANRCYEAEFHLVDMEWQVAHED